jgi:hypothetical protein
LEVVQFKCDIVTDAWQLGVLEPELGHLCCLDEQAGKIKEAQVQRLEHQADEIDILEPHNNKQTKTSKNINPHKVSLSYNLATQHSEATG